MYRIFCESCQAYIKQYQDQESWNEYRYKMTRPLQLISDIAQYKKHEQENSLLYKQVNDLIVFMRKHTHEYPKFKAFLWTLESREIKGKYFGIVPPADLREQSKLINMFLNLLYWEE